MMSEESPAIRFSGGMMRRSLIAAASVSGRRSSALSGAASPTRQHRSTRQESPERSSLFSWRLDLLGVKAGPCGGTRTRSRFIRHTSAPTTTLRRVHDRGRKGIYNLSTYEAGYGPFYVGLGIPSPIRLVRVLPNFKIAYPIFQSGAVASKWWNFKGQQWALPFTWGVQGVNYDASKIKAPDKLQRPALAQIEGQDRRHRRSGRRDRDRGACIRGLPGPTASIPPLS